METLNISLNEFDIRSIRCLCPDFNLKFDISEVHSDIDVIYSTIEVYDLDDKYITTVYPSIFNTVKKRWFKLEGDSIIKEINDLKHKKPISALKGSK